VGSKPKIRSNANKLMYKPVWLATNVCRVSQSLGVTMTIPEIEMVETFSKKI